MSIKYIYLLPTGNTLTIETEPNDQYSSAFFAPRTVHEFVEFGIMACQDVKLGMFQNNVCP